MMRCFAYFYRDYEPNLKQNFFFVMHQSNVVLSLKTFSYGSQISQYLTITLKSVEIAIKNILTLFASSSKNFRQLLKYHIGVDFSVFGKHFGFGLHCNSALNALPFASSSFRILGFFLFLFALLTSLCLLPIFAIFLIFSLLLVIVTTCYLQEFLLKVSIFGVIFRRRCFVLFI